MDPIELVTTLTSAMKGVDIDVYDQFGQTPLHRAALRGATVSCMHLLQVIYANCSPLCQSSVE